MNNRVRILRQERRWSQDRLSAHVGVSRRCIDAIEKERFLPSITLAYNIAFEFEKDVLEVFPPQRHATRPFPQPSEHQVVSSKKSSFQSGGAQ
jgi:putative transcriptional regulator